MLRITQHFDRWDRDDSGHLTWSELRQNAADPSIQGREAAALATLHALVRADASDRDLIRMPSVDKADVFNMQADYLDSEETPLADQYYRKYLGKLETASDDLFPHQQLPNGFNVAQGAAPSCGFLAATFAQTRKDPRVVQEALTELPDGRLSVKFPGLEKPIVIQPATDTEVAMHASAGPNGAWLTNLEKAWGTHTGKNPLAAFEKSTWPEDALKAWTGGKATTARIPKNAKKVKKGELPAYLRTAQRELASNHLAITWTRFDDFSDKQLVYGHAYTLTGIDEDKGTVELRNPWGHYEPTNAKGQPLDGRDDGVFQLSFQDFATCFSHIARQTD